MHPSGRLYHHLRDFQELFPVPSWSWLRPHYWCSSRRVETDRYGHYYKTPVKDEGSITCLFDIYMWPFRVIPGNAAGSIVAKQEDKRGPVIGAESRWNPQADFCKTQKQIYWLLWTNKYCKAKVGVRRKKMCLHVSWSTRRLHGRLGQRPDWPWDIGADAGTAADPCFHYFWAATSSFLMMLFTTEPL